jgi:hypothetical protein
MSLWTLRPRLRMRVKILVAKLPGFFPAQKVKHEFDAKNPRVVVPVRVSPTSSTQNTRCFRR